MRDRRPAPPDRAPRPGQPRAVHLVLVLVQIAFGSLAVEGKRSGRSPGAIGSRRGARSASGSRSRASARFALPHRGDALVLLNAASYATYIVFSKRALARHGTMTVLAWIFGSGALLFAPIGAPALAREALSWPAATLDLVAFIVLVPTAFAYSDNAWALGRATPGLVTIYVYLQPLVVAALAWAQLAQPPDARALLAGPMILAGVALVAIAPRRRPATCRAPASRDYTHPP